MKILIYKAETALGQIVLTRLRRGGHKVIAVYCRDTDKKAAAAGRNYVWYEAAAEEKLRDIFKYEAPEFIIDADIGDVSDRKAADERIKSAELLSRLSAECGVRKVLMISSLDVYGKKIYETVTEQTEPEPENINGKTAYVCENMLTGFRKSAGFINVIYRAGTVWTAENYLLNEIMASAESGRAFDEAYAGIKIPVYIQDLADAAVKAVSDNVYGIYNVCGSEAVSGEAVYNMALRKLKKTEFEIEQPAVTVKAPLCAKIEHEAGWVRFYTVQTAFDRIFDEWLKKRPAAATEHKKEKKREHGHFRGYLESTVLYILLILIIRVVPDTGASSLLLLYCVGASVFGGIYHGIYAAVLMTGFEIYNMLSAGFLPETLVFNYSFLLKIISFFVAAVCIGYAVERKNTKIRQAKETIRLLGEDHERIVQMNESLARAKSIYEDRLLKYEDGLARLYTVFTNVKMTSVNEVLLEAPSVVKKLTREENVSVYVVQQSSGYMRRFTYIGQPLGVMPTSFRYADIEAYENIVSKGTFYVNRHMDKHMPGIMIPVIIRGKTEALIVLEKISLDKLNRYYLNMFKISGHIISDFCEKTASKEEIVSELVYEGHSRILKREYFKLSCDTAEAAAKNTGFNYCILKVLLKENENMAAEKLRRLLRSKDEIGRLPDGGLGVLLYGTDVRQAGIVRERFAGIGIESRVL